MEERLFVLEASWDDDFGDKRTVRPFIDGWAANAEIGYAYRAYNDRDDLRYWIELFCRHPTANTLYIAGHGFGTRLVGLGDRGINITTLLGQVFKRTRTSKRGPSKGILVGACQCFGNRTRARVLQATNRRLKWVAGYSVDLPWLESMLLDLAFLEYRFRGRIRPRAPTDGAPWQLYRYGGTVQSIAKWVCDDFPLARRWGFGVAVRSRTTRR